MQDILHAMGRLRQSDLAVVVAGDSGTGKEREAAALQQHSPRCGEPFNAIISGAIPGDLMEADHFGHEDGCSCQTEKKPG